MKELIRVLKDLVVTVRQQNELVRANNCITASLLCFYSDQQHHMDYAEFARKYIHENEHRCETVDEQEEGRLK